MAFMAFINNCFFSFTRDLSLPEPTAEAGLAMDPIRILWRRLRQGNRRLFLTHTVVREETPSAALVHHMAFSWLLARPVGCLLRLAIEEAVHVVVRKSAGVDAIPVRGRASLLGGI